MRGRASRIFVIAATWTFAWLLFWGMFVGAIAIVDPDSVDPGEGTMLFVVFGPMGLLTGLAIGAILTISAETTLREVSLTRAAVWGFLATAFVQVFYLGHGDAGLAANVKMALLFAAVGALLTIILASIARWRHRRLSAPATAAS